ncbi:MAG: hypothetical protein ACRECT_03600 [Thermoplasmata archaeon]
MTETIIDEPTGESTLQLENWTRERVLTLFGVNPAASEEVKSDLPQKGRVRLNNPTNYSGRGVVSLTLGSKGSLVRIPLTTGLPSEGLLGVVPDVLGLPPPRAGVLLVVDKEVTFALHQRGVHRRDLLTPGRVRYDLCTKKRLGFEGLNRIEFTGVNGKPA